MACVHQFYIFKYCLGFGRSIQPTTQTSPVRRANSPDHPNPALAITEVPSPPIARIGWALRVLLLSDSSTCLKDRKVSEFDGGFFVTWLVVVNIIQNVITFRISKRASNGNIKENYPK